MGQLSNLPNIGKVVEKQLNEAGIMTTEQLIQTGTEQSWLKIQEIDKSACIHRLLAIEGAICGIKKTDIHIESKTELKEFYNLHKK